MQLQGKRTAKPPFTPTRHPSPDGALNAGTVQLLSNCCHKFCSLNKHFLFTGCFNMVLFGESELGLQEISLLPQMQLEIWGVNEPDPTDCAPPWTGRLWPPLKNFEVSRNVLNFQGWSSYGVSVQRAPGQLDQSDFATVNKMMLRSIFSIPIALLGRYVLAA